MRKILFITILVASTIWCNAQGIKLTGNTYTDQSTGLHIDSLFTYLNYNFRGSDSMVLVYLPIASSQANAKGNNFITMPQTFGIPSLTYQFKSIMGLPNQLYLYNTLKPWLQGQNFTVTTF